MKPVFGTGSLPVALKLMTWVCIPFSGSLWVTRLWEGLQTFCRSRVAESRRASTGESRLQDGWPSPSSSRDYIDIVSE